MRLVRSGVEAEEEGSLRIDETMLKFVGLVAPFLTRSMSEATTMPKWQYRSEQTSRDNEQDSIIRNLSLFSDLVKRRSKARRWKLKCFGGTSSHTLHDGGITEQRRSIQGFRISHTS